MKKYLELKVAGLDNLETSTVKDKIKEALKDSSSVKPKITSVVNKDFGIDGNVNVENSENTVEVKINNGRNEQGSATVNVQKVGESSSQPITIQVMGNESDLDANKGGNIAKRLVKAVEIAASLVPNLSGFAVNSDDETVTNVQDYLAQKLRDAGSAEFKALVDKLKEQNITKDDLTAEKLVNAINGSGSNTSVKTALANWVNFKYWSNIKADNIVATLDTEQDGNRKVKVHFTGGGVKDGNGESSQTVTKSGQNDVKVTITIDSENKRGSLVKKSDEGTANNNTQAGEIANKIASFVAVAALAHKLNTDGSIDSPENLTTEKLKNAIGTVAGTKPVQTAISELVNAMFGATVAPGSGGTGKEITASEAGDTVTVRIGKSKEFKDLVDELAKQVKSYLTGGLSDQQQIAQALQRLLEAVKETQLKNFVESMVEETKKSLVGSVIVNKESSNKVTVTIGTGSDTKGEASVTITKKSGGTSVELKIEVKGNSGTTDLTNEEGTAIANLVALAMVNENVKNAVDSTGYTITLKDKDKVQLKK